jgi:lipoprotein Spr
MFCKIIFGLSLFLAFAGSALAGNGTGNIVKPDENTLQAFFCAHQVELDSCQPPAFYQTIYQWMGARYRSKTPSGRALDCSGFAGLVYKEAYQIKLNGGSYSIYPQTTPLAKNELQPGDLVFFKIRKGRISHVGIYLGNNKFVHSATRGGVRIDDLNDAYYKRYFFKGGRILPTS